MKRDKRKAERLHEKFRKEILDKLLKKTKMIKEMYIMGKVKVSEEKDEIIMLDCDTTVKRNMRSTSLKSSSFDDEEFFGDSNNVRLYTSYILYVYYIYISEESKVSSI